MPASKVTLNLGSKLVDIHEHLNYIFAGVRGYVAVCPFVRPTGGGKAKPRETLWFSWPNDVEDMGRTIESLAEQDRVEVYYCPYPMRTKNRILGNSAERRIIHADVDGMLDAETKYELVKRGFRFVASGSKGHYHIYGRLNRSVTAAEHRGLELALRKHIGSDAKIADNDILRIPETTNWKHGTPVYADVPSNRVLVVDDLMRWLRAVPVESGAAARTTWTDVPVPKRLPAVVRQLLRETAEDSFDGNRSDQMYRAILTVCEENERGGHGWSADEIHAILAGYAPGVESGHDWDADIERVIAKYQGKAGNEIVQVDPDDIWDRREVLKHIYSSAYAMMANPWAVLGMVAARVCAMVPTNVEMPGINNHQAVGTRCLNFFTMLIGPSGGGKKAATDAARSAVDVGLVPKGRPLGSGEGMVKAYMGKESRDFKMPDGSIQKRYEDVMHTTAVMFEVAEVASWNALAGRTGATLLPEILKAFSGETLGFGYAQDDKALVVPEDGYRFCLTIGAQPKTCGPIMDQMTSGLPQRFLFMPTDILEPEDFDMTRLAGVDSLEPMVINLPQWPGDGKHVMRFPEETLNERRRARWAGEKDELESHYIVVKMRMACVFALLDGRQNVSVDDWELATVVMMKHRSTRGSVREALTDMSRVANARVGRARAQQDRAARRETEKHHREDIDKTKRRIRTMLEGGEWTTTIKRNVGRVYRDSVDEALKEMVEAKEIKHRVKEIRGGQAHYYRLA